MLSSEGTASKENSGKTYRRWPGPGHLTPGLDPLSGIPPGGASKAPAVFVTSQHKGSLSNYVSTGIIVEARAQPGPAQCAFPEKGVSDRQVCSAEIKSWRVTTGTLLSSRTELHRQRHMESLMSRRPHLRPPTPRERKLKADREL